MTASLGVKMEEAKKTLHQYRIEKLPVVDSDGKLKGLITIKDITKTIHFLLPIKISTGNLELPQPLA